MVIQAMEGRSNHIGFQLMFVLVFIVGLHIQHAWSLDYEGVVSLEFRGKLKLNKDAIHGCGDDIADKSTDSARRRLVEQPSQNLEAETPRDSRSTAPISTAPLTRSSGSFPAVPSVKKNETHPRVSETPPLEEADAPIAPARNRIDHQSTAKGTMGNKWMYLFFIPIIFVMCVVTFSLIVMCRKRGVTSIGPWKTGLSGQLQKAFVTGVPKLKRSELETACEDFSNIIDTINGCTMYKGTLSSGIEIAVTSTSIASSKDWSNNAEKAYRNKVDTLSRINHKNFINLIGYCEEDEPFYRMMVFEYAPNGTLFEHLHVKEMEHLDWTARMRIAMGTAYCLQYMHELKPPIPHSNLTSHCIYLTDDYAAKIKEVCFLPETTSSLKNSGTIGPEKPVVVPHQVNLETNIYGFGILLLEIISGKYPFAEKQGTFDKWAVEYLNDIQSKSCNIDPTLKSYKKNELDVICEVIQECVQSDPRQRPTMKDITSKLHSVITISPDQAIPRLSPLWWAELEILSSEAT